jgi:hypothetical protein
MTKAKPNQVPMEHAAVVRCGSLRFAACVRVWMEMPVWSPETRDPLFFCLGTCVGTVFIAHTPRHRVRGYTKSSGVCY